MAPHVFELDNYSLSSLKMNRNMLSSRKVRKKYMYSITNIWFYYQAADMAQAAL